MSDHEGKPTILVIVGPTAVGKSRVAMQVAEETNVEIIAADSMQAYRGMDIGTAKPTREERERCDIYQSRFACIEGVDVRGIVIIPKHLDHDPEESG